MHRSIRDVNHLDWKEGCEFKPEQKPLLEHHTWCSSTSSKGVLFAGINPPQSRYKL